MLPPDFFFDSWWRPLSDNGLDEAELGVTIGRRPSTPKCELATQEQNRGETLENKQILGQRNYLLGYRL